MKTLTTQKLEWRDRALCKELDPNVFFPDLRGVKNLEEYIDKELPCNRCEVKEECLDFAEENECEWGVWGGEYRSPYYTPVRLRG